MIDIVITCHNYGRFLANAIESCLNQSSPCNIIVVNDGSTDETATVCAKYHREITVVLTQNKGLANAANAGIARGVSPLVCRLDADDWLHPDFCLMMESYFRQFQNTGAVYCDCFEDSNGEQRIVEQKETPLGSCVVFDRHVFEVAGGYDESLSYQEDFDLWQRLMTDHRRHINLPLWYYRKHEAQMSNAWNDRQRVRHDIKEQHGSAVKVLAVIPARGNSKGIPRKNMRLLGGVPLVARAIRMAKKCERDMLIAVSTEDAEIAHLARREGVEVIDRPPELSEDDVSTIAPVKHAMEYMDAKGWKADIVVSIQVTDPFTPPEKLAEAIDAVVLSRGISAVAITEIRGTHPYRAFRLRPFANRIEPYFRDESEKYLQRQDRPKAYGFTGGFYVRRRTLLEGWSGKGYAIGDSVCGVIVPPEAAVDIDTQLDLWLAETIIAHREEL